jgi:hypothetical protein
VADQALLDHRSACERRIAALTASQGAYVQNLYGKIHAAQMASEKAAAAVMCDTKERELKEDLDHLAKECAELKCR